MDLDCEREFSPSGKDQLGPVLRQQVRDQTTNSPSTIRPTRRSTIHGAGASATGAGGAGFFSFGAFSFFFPPASGATPASIFCSPFFLSLTALSTLACLTGLDAAGSAAAASGLGFLTLASGLISTRGTLSTSMLTCGGVSV